MITYGSIHDKSEDLTVALSQPLMDKVIYGLNVSGGIPPPSPPEAPFQRESAHKEVNKHILQYQL